jgi:hypothetical protein
VTDAAPSTPAEATARLDQLKSDPGWRDLFLAGNGPQVSEFHSLHELMAKEANTTLIDKAMNGGALDGEMQTSEYVEMRGAAAMFSELGIRSEIIKDVLAGTHKVTKEEYQATERWKADRLRDADWTAKYMSGDREEQRRMTLANIIITGGIRDEKAA